MKSRRPPAAFGGAWSRAVVVRDPLRALLLKDRWTIFRGTIFREDDEGQSRSLPYAPPESRRAEPPSDFRFCCAGSLPRRVCLLSRTRIADKTRTRTRPSTLDTRAEFSQLASAIVCRFERTIHNRQDRDLERVRITADSRRRGNPLVLRRPYVADDRGWLARARRCNPSATTETVTAQ